MCCYVGHRMSRYQGGSTVDRGEEFSEICDTGCAPTVAGRERRTTVLNSKLVGGPGFEPGA
jgi:hypothetical protein